MIFQTKHRALKSGRLITGALIPPVLMLSAACADASDRHRQNQSDPATGIIMESLDRGLVVIPAEQGNAVSWRLLGTDPLDISFDIYRNGHKLNGKKLSGATFFTDPQGDKDDVYEIKASGLNNKNKRKKDRSAAMATAWQDVMLQIPLNKPADGWVNGQSFSYSANDGSVADLTGDGRYEFIVKWYPSNAKDNSQAGHTGNTYLDAYTLEGQQLWRIDLGRNIRSGAHYTQFVAYDFDQDGRAEVAMKTADGTVDGEGTVIGDANADYRNSQGYVLEGPEFLTMFDGLSGKALDTIDYVPERGSVSSWGDGYGNRVDRFLAGVGYLDGSTPTAFFARGYYTRAVVSAFDWVDGQFVSRWVYDSNNGGADAGGYGQGAHSISVGDVDGDGKDEIVYGAATIDDDGHLLYSTDLGHGDALHMSDIDPERPGLEIHMVHESPSAYTKDGTEYGVELHDAATGEILWHRPGNGTDVGRGVSADIDPAYVGNENWATRGGLVAANGTVISDTRPSQVNFLSWWDGDLNRELLDGNRIYKWQPATETSEVILDGSEWGAVSNNGTKATPVLSADILGDWREEVIWANSDSSALLLFSTTEDTEYRIPALMHNPQYRTAIAWQNVGYNQPPHPSFYLGSDMKAMPVYDIQTQKSQLWLKPVARGNAESVEISVHSNGYPYKGMTLYKSLSDDPETRELLTTLDSGESRFVDTDVEPDTRYYYWGSVKSKHGEPELLPVTTATLTSSDIPDIRTYHQSSASPVTLSWFTANIEVSSVSVFRAERVEGEADPVFEQASGVASLAADSTQWTDESSVPGTPYIYWLVFDTASKGQITSDPVNAERLLEPKTHLSAVQNGDGIVISWQLEDFPQAIRGVQLYRNTKAELSGRTRISPSAPVSGSLTDTLSLVNGTTYWYMFKLTMEDGTTYNTEPEAAVTFVQ